MTEKTRENSVYDFIRGVTDTDSFIEVDALVVSESGACSGEGVVSGFAEICGQKVGIFVTDPNVLKGSIGSRNATKIVKCINNAIKTGNPIIAVLDTSGARFSEGIEVMEAYGKILGAFSRAYGLIPTICVVKGNNFGMLSYLTACCDLCIAYDKAVIATASPLILAAKTKYDASFIGTASIHAQQTGVIGKVVRSDAELKESLARFIDLTINKNKEPEDDPNRLCSSLNENSKAEDIIPAVFDKDSFFEIRKDYSKEFITGFARLNGMTVGVIAANGAVNEGKLSDTAAKEISLLVRTCENFGIPVVSLLDSEGVRKNIECENTDLIWELSSMIYSLCHSKVCKVALISGNAIGLAYVALASKSVFDYTVAWKGANISMIDNDAATTLIYADEIAKGETLTEKKEITEKFSKKYTEENCAADVIARAGYLDNVIDPTFTRQYLIAGVQMFSDKR